MAYQHTLRDAQNAGLDNISGVCADSQQFTQYINEIQRRILKRGGWWGTEWVVKLCIHSGCVTWPRYVGAVLGMRFCGTGAIDVQNNWFSILRPESCCPGTWATNVVAYDNGTAPTYNDITGSSGQKVRVYLEHGNDAGKTITIFGIDATTNMPLQEERDGSWQPGIQLTLAAPYVETTQLVKRITSVLKDTTQGHLFLFQYNSSTGLLRDLARYEPNETNPRYRRSKVQNFCSTPTCGESNGASVHSIEAMVKLEFIPVQNQNDFLIIDDFDALKLGVQAIRLEEAGDDAAAETKFLKAVREMHFTDRSKNPVSQTAVRVEPVGAYISSPM